MLNTKTMINRNLIRSIILNTLVYIAFTGCVTKQGLIKKTQGNYDISISKSNSTRDPFVYGVIKEYRTNDPLNGGIIKIDNKIIKKANNAGKFEFNIKSGRHTFTNMLMGYYILKSENIKLIAGDTIKIDFYLKPDTTTKLIESKINR